MDKVLVTGASGFIGQALVEALVPNYEVWCTYERAEHKAKNPKIPGSQKVLMNLKDPYGIDNVVELVKPHFVIHLGAKTEVEYSFQDYHDVSLVDYVGTVDLAEANRRLNPNLKCFIMASTMETYGFGQNPTPFTEGTPQHPAAPYAVAKTACEHYLRYMEYAYRFPFVALRLTNTYGRYDNDYFVMERIITQMLDGQVCNLGNPRPYRNFLYIDDLVELFQRVLKVADQDIGVLKGQVFVTGPDNAVTIQDLAEMVKERLGWSGVINWDTIPVRPGEIYYLNSDPEKAKRLLNWEPKTPLSRGIDKTIATWKQNKEE